MVRGLGLGSSSVNGSSLVIFIKGMNFRLFLKEFMLVLYIVIKQFGGITVSSI